MKVDIVRVQPSSDARAEYVILRATRPASLGHFILFRARQGEGQSVNSPEFVAWLDDVDLARGDEVVVFTGSPPPLVATNDRHEVYLNRKASLWMDAAHVALLAEVAAWTSL